MQNKTYSSIFMWILFGGPPCFRCFIYHHLEVLNYLNTTSKETIILDIFYSATFLNFKMQNQLVKNKVADTANQMHLITNHQPV